MDSVRYSVALLTLITFIPGILFWPLAHGLVQRWRRLGLVVSYTLLGAFMLGLSVGIFSLRETLLTVEFGTNLWLYLPATLCFAAAMVIGVQCRKHLTLRTLVGIPELSPTPTSQKLLDQGVYARMRHPRYVAVMLSMPAVALFTNYLALYVLCPLVVVTLYIITVLEERELLERFGTAYEQYRQRVPRFLSIFSGTIVMAHFRG